MQIPTLQLSDFHFPRSLSDPVLLGYLGLMLLGLAHSALFSGIETGMYTINRVRLLVRAGQGDRAALRLQAELAQPGRLLATLLAGNNIANYLGSFGFAAALDHLRVGPATAVAVNALILVPLLFVFGETLPKDLFRSHTDRWSYRWSGFLRFSRVVFTSTGLLPILQLATQTASRFIGGSDDTPVTARQRISHLIREGVGAGVLTEQQTTLVDRALSMRNRTVSSEMIHWRQVVTISADAGAEPRRQIVARHNYTRLPAVDAHGEVVGVVSVLDMLLDLERPIRELMSKPLLLGPETQLVQAMRAVRCSPAGIGVIIGADRSQPLGIVTLKDLVEPLTGELSAW